MQLSIIIPCFNEEKIIESTIKRVCKTFEGIDYEVILVDDGSTDSTSEHIIKKFNQNRKQIIFDFNDENIGKGNAFYRGVKLAKYDLILLLDADLSVDPSNFFNEDIQARIEYSIKRFNKFIIATQRIQIVPQPLFRIFVGKCFKVLVFLITGIYMDTQNPFKLFYRMKKDMVNNSIDGFAFDVEILYNAKRNGIRIFKPKVDYLNNENSKVTFRKTIQMLFDLIKLRYLARDSPKSKDYDSEA